MSVMVIVGGGRCLGTVLWSQVETKVSQLVCTGVHLDSLGLEFF